EEGADFRTAGSHLDALDELIDRDHRRCRTGHLILASCFLVTTSQAPTPRVGVVGKGRHTRRVPGHVACGSHQARPLHYEESIWLRQECRSEIPLLRGRELPDVV